MEWVAGVAWSIHFASSTAATAAMAGSVKNELSLILSSRLLHNVFRFRFGQMDSEEDAMRQVDLWKAGIPDDVSDELYDQVWPALQKLSKFGPHLDTVSSVWVVLPEPDDRNFLPEAVALIMLLDQCPRIYCSGRDVRWANTFFDSLAQDVVWRLLAVPPDNNILNAEAWKTLGFGYPAFLVISSLVLSAADHSERLDQHVVLRRLMQARKAEILSLTGEPDPFVAQLEQDENDVYAFARVMRKGLPKVHSTAEFAYLRSYVISIHFPIIHSFGRYPWRNTSLARTSTESEEAFLEKTRRFGEPKAQVIEAIRRDVEEDRWVEFGSEV